MYTGKKIFIRMKNPVKNIVRIKYYKSTEKEALILSFLDNDRFQFNIYSEDEAGNNIPDLFQKGVKPSRTEYLMLLVHLYLIFFKVLFKSEYYGIYSKELPKKFECYITNFVGLYNILCVEIIYLKNKIVRVVQLRNLTCINLLY